jgi:hypothetical protein
MSWTRIGGAAFLASFIAAMACTEFHQIDNCYRISRTLSTLLPRIANIGVLASETNPPARNRKGG